MKNKTLYLVRHAKSSWKEPAQSDYDRPLNDRGNKDKLEMSKRLAGMKTEIDLLLSSSAKRTRQTTQALVKELNLPEDKVVFKESLYHASVMDLLKEITVVPEEVDNLIMVGHNPGVSIFCDYLTDDLREFPTLGIAKINFELDSWQELSKGLGKLEWFDYPKNR